MKKLSLILCVIALLPVAANAKYACTPGKLISCTCKADEHMTEEQCADAIMKICGDNSSGWSIDGFSKCKQLPTSVDASDRLTPYNRR